MNNKDTIDLMNKASEAYYNSDTPIMSDAMYDALVGNCDELKVGAEISGNIDKINIAGKAMKSLKKAHSAKEITDALADNQLCVSVKCDGLSTRLIYENGKLISANTRGNGIVGGNITEHIKYFTNIPVEISKKERYVVDGESIIYQNDFDTIKDVYNLKNPRNAAAGALSTKDTTFAKNYKLSFILWDVIEGYNSNSYNENLEEALNLGFTIVPHIIYQPSESMDDINETIMHTAETSLIPCDGVVWKIDDIVTGRAYGETDHHFCNAVAWKPANEVYISHLLDIEWTMGRTGRLTPTAVFEPIEIDGTTVERASLHNITVMDDLLGIPYVGQEVEVAKMNMIIPQILNARWMERGEDVKIIPTPYYCPICGAPTEARQDNDSQFLFCTNDLCDGKLINILDHFAGKTGLDIKGISEMTLEKLIDWGWVNDFADIINLKDHRAEWVIKEGFGAKSVDNILAAIESASHEVALDKFICAIGIPLIGTVQAKEIIKVFKTWEDFRNAVTDGYDFSHLEGFGESKTRAILDFNYTKADRVFDYLIMAELEEEEEVNQSLAGMLICVTGALKLYKNRTELTKAIELHGGKVTSSVSKKTNYLLTNNTTSGSSKNVTAAKLGIPVITEQEFYEKFLS